MAEQDVKERFHANYEAVSTCLNFHELVPLLCQNKVLLSLNEAEPFLERSNSRKHKTILLAQKLDDSSMYSKFLECLKREKTHLGHVYVYHLLNGTEYASDSEIAHSQAIKDIIHEKLPEFTKFLNLRELLPHIFQYELVTESENEFYHSHTNQVLEFLLLLNSKGPLAHSLFGKCLQNEDSHPAHRELCSYIEELCPAQKLNSKKCEESETTELCSKKLCLRRKRELIIEQGEMTLCKKPFVFKVHGKLTSKTYRVMVLCFQFCQYHGEWDTLDRMVAQYTQKCYSCEIQTAALLEKAASSIFQGHFDVAFDLISKAREKNKLVSGTNSTFLEARCEYTLSLFYRYLKQYAKAVEHADNAKKVMFLAEQGHDRALTCLNYASALIESDPSKTEEAKGYISDAIYCADTHSTGLQLILPHSYIKLAQLHLGSTYLSPGCANDDSSIRDAESCLNKVNVESLLTRFKCRFYLIESDLYRCKGMPSESSRVARYALNEAKGHNFANEIKAAEVRLSSL